MADNTMKIEERMVIEAVGVGKHTDPVGHVAICAWNETNKSEKAHGGHVDFIPAETPLPAKLMEIITKELQILVADGKRNTAVEVYTLLGGVVLKYRQIYKQYNLNKQNGVDELDLSQFHEPSFMNETYTKIVDNFAKALKALWDNGNIIRLVDSKLINYIELIVPEGVRIPRGTELKFVNSKASFKASNGYTYEIGARFKNLNREHGRVVILDEDTDYPVYAIKLSNNPSGRTLQLLNTRAGLYKLCPVQTVDRVAEMLENIA